MSASVEDTGRSTLPIVMTQMPVMWGMVEEGEFWWGVQADRYCMRGADHRVIDLYVGALCDEHGFEGSFVGTTGIMQEALDWVCGGPRPTGAALH